MGLKSASSATQQICNMVLKTVLELKVFCGFLCCVLKKIYMCSGLLLSLIYYRTGAKERKTEHRQRTHLAMSYRFPLPASSNYNKKKMFFTNGTHGVSIVKMCLLKNSFHKRSYCAKEVIFSLWGPLATFCLLSPKNSCYGIFGFVVILLCLSLSWFLCICACMYVCSHLHMCICVPLYLNSFSSPLLSL